MLVKEPDITSRKVHLVVLFTLWLLGLVLFPIVATLQINPSMPVSIVWDFGNYFGFSAMALMLILFAYTSQPRRFPIFNGKFFVNLHKHLGYLALLFVLAHIIVLISYEPLLLEHLKPSAPYYMLSGLLASLASLVLVVASVPFVRKKIWDRHTDFKNTHVVLSVTVMVLIFIHILGSKFYVNSPLKEWVWAIVFSTCFLLPRVSRSQVFRKLVVNPQLRRVNKSGTWSNHVVKSIGVVMFLVFAYIAVMANLK